MLNSLLPINVAVLIQLALKLMMVFVLYFTQRDYPSKIGEQLTESKNFLIYSANTIFP
jgi:hypothetical protein